jgi:hypothetical protein
MCTLTLSKLQPFLDHFLSSDAAKALNIRLANNQLPYRAGSYQDLVIGYAEVPTEFDFHELNFFIAADTRLNPPRVMIRSFGYYQVYIEHMHERRIILSVDYENAVSSRAAKASALASVH